MGRMSSNYQHNSYEQEKPEPNERNSKTPSMSDDASKEICGKDGKIVVTRIKKPFTNDSLYKMASDIQKTNTDGTLYISRSQIYKYCIDESPEPFEAFRKVSDANIISLSRIPLRDMVHCYLFSLIHPNTLSFDKTGSLFCYKIKRDFEKISQLEYELANSIMLDGFLLAFDEIITNDNNTYCVEEDIETEDGQKDVYKVIKIKDRKSQEIKEKDYDYHLELLELLSSSLLYFLELRDDIRGKADIAVPKQKVLKQKFFVCDDYATDRIILLFEKYNSLTEDMLRITEKIAGKIAGKYRQVKEKNSDQGDNQDANTGKDDGNPEGYSSAEDSSNPEDGSSSENNSKSEGKEDEQDTKLDIRLYVLLNLYHINRYTHIFDMDMMRYAHEATLNFHKLGGFLTAITLNKIFNPDPDKRIDALKKDLRLMNSILYPNVLEERDYEFIRTLIFAVAGRFKDVFLYHFFENCTHRKKACKMFYDFSKDSSVQAFLDDMDIEKYIYTKIDFNPVKKTDQKSDDDPYIQFKYCFNIIYEDLYRTADYGKRLCKEYLESIDGLQITGISPSKLANNLYYLLHDYIEPER